MTIMDLLPDSRSKSGKGAVQTKIPLMPFFVPIYCANCGEEGGMVPEDTTTFAFYLCNDCVDKHGHVEGTYIEPDAAFWQRVHAEMMEKYGRILTPNELDEVALANTTPLAALLREGRNT